MAACCPFQCVSSTQAACVLLCSSSTDVARLQVYTAEEKAALAMLNVEENKKKEDKILGDMRRLVQRSLATEEEEEQAEAAQAAADPKEPVAA